MIHIRMLVTTATLAVLTMLLTCCTIDPARIPIPGATVTGPTYPINVEFTSVLNLPARAKVDLDGTTVGVLDHVTLQGSSAVATVEITSAITLAPNTRAELRQATILGDIYIALIAPADPLPGRLHAGDTIALANTTPADNVEDLLRSTSELVNGGALPVLQDAVVAFNDAFPADPGRTTFIQTKIAATLKDLADNQRTIDEILTSAEAISDQLVVNKSTFDRLITEGPAKIAGLGGVFYAVVTLLMDSRQLSVPEAALLMPIAPDLIGMLDILGPAIATASTSDTTIPVIADKTVELFRDKVIPWLRRGGPRFTVGNLTAVGVNDLDARAHQLQTLLQTMGLMRPR